MMDVLFQNFFPVVALIGMILFFKLKFYPKPKPKEKKSFIHIIVDQKPVSKHKNTNRQNIIKEAETLFQSLQKKYLYSPLPYKVLGDFYGKNQMPEMALLKYSEMIRYLNNDLSLNKLNDVLLYLEKQRRQDIADQIKSFYSSGSNP